MVSNFSWGKLVALAGLGVLVWYFVVPDSAPSCTASSIVRNAESMVRVSMMKSRSRNPFGEHQNPFLLKLDAVRELGYMRPERVRGCVATIVGHEVPMPFAFTLQPEPPQSNKFMIVGADPALVQARFGQLDEQGRSRQQAEPIGRRALEDALRAGVKAYDAQASSELAKWRLLARVAGPRANKTEGERGTDRERDVAEVEPLAPCRELERGKRYACRVMVEYNDPRRRAMGWASRVIVEGEFTLERHLDSAPWQTGELFPREFVGALEQAWQQRAKRPS